MDSYPQPSVIVRGLAKTVARIEAVGARLSAEHLVTPAEPGGWSSNEILWHIRATADVYGKHIARMLDEDEPRWSHVSPRAQMKKSRYDQVPFAESLAEFAKQRAELVDRLDGIGPEAWERVALVKVKWMKDDWRLTLHERVGGMVNHEQIHCAQMEEEVRKRE